MANLRGIPKWHNCDEGSLVTHELYQALAHTGFAYLDFERTLASAFRCVTFAMLSSGMPLCSDMLPVHPLEQCSKPLLVDYTTKHIGGYHDP